MTEIDPLAVGVIGVGSMGTHHARVLSELPNTTLVGVADTDPGRASEIANKHGTEHVARHALIESADAVTIAVPTNAHFETAVECLQSDTHVLVEKPFVSEIDHGTTLASLADRRGLILQVGHIERFNPAVQALIDLIDIEDIVAIRTDRLGPPVQRGGADDVVMDLMIHDIDILLHLLGQSPITVRGVNRGDSYASVLMEFASGSVATLTASRITQRKIRTLEVTTLDRHFVMDFIDQSIRIHRRSRPSYLQDDTEMRYRHESIIEQPLIESAEPLRLELESFVEAVQYGEPPQVTATEGIEALSVALSIKQQFTDKQDIEVPHP